MTCDEAREVVHELATAVTMGSPRDQYFERMAIMTSMKTVVVSSEPWSAAEQDHQLLTAAEVLDVSEYIGRRWFDGRMPGSVRLRSDWAFRA